MADGVKNYDGRDDTGHRDGSFLSLFVRTLYRVVIYMKEYTYQYEMHCHTNWCSACAHNSPEEMAAAYFQAGYAGMVITDHFLSGNTAVNRALPWEDKARRYWEAYGAAKNWGAGKGFTVLFGLEHLYGDGKEVLTYGIDLDFLLAHPDLDKYSLEDYSAAVHKAGGFLSHAHPFRHAPYINTSVPPRIQYMDAVETFNFYNEDEENRQAARLAREKGLLTTSGGDEHIQDGEAIGRAGVLFPVPSKDNQELVSLLRAGDYKLCAKGQAVSKDSLLESV